jgi:hypothetical protein
MSRDRGRYFVGRIASARGLPEVIALHDGSESRGRAVAAGSEQRRKRLNAQGAGQFLPGGRALA